MKVVSEDKFNSETEKLRELLLKTEDICSYACKVDTGNPPEVKKNSTGSEERGE